MSRLTQPPVKDGDAINAASLNDRFTQFTQTDLNQFNTRDAAIDLPQFKGGVTRFLAPQMFIGAIGANDWKHATDVTVTGQVTGSLPHVVSDAAGAATPLSFGATGMTLTQNEEMLRVYWDMSVRPRWEGTRPYTASDLIWVFSTGGSTQNVFSGYGCWAFWLQWDITSNALANFVNVPGQGNFNGIVTGSRGGNPLSTCQSTSVVQSIIETGGAWCPDHPCRLDCGGRSMALPPDWKQPDHLRSAGRLLRSLRCLQRRGDQLLDPSRQRGWRCTPRLQRWWHHWPEVEGQMTENAHQYWAKQVSTTYGFSTIWKHVDTASAQCSSRF